MNLHEWPKPNVETPKPVEKTEQIESEKSIEQELSPEQIEQIMAKVQDIDRPGIGFSVISSANFNSIINEGLLGAYNECYEPKNKIDWAKKTRTEKNSNVYINITGRQEIDIEGECEIGQSNWVRMHTNSKDVIVMLFDISKFKEEAPLTNIVHLNTKFKPKTYRSAENHSNFLSAKELSLLKYGSPEYNKAVEPLVQKYIDTDYGFALTHRVSPKFFTGIVARMIPDEDWNKEGPDWGHFGDYSVTHYIGQPEVYERIAPYLKQMLEAKKNLMPIYDIFGNLLWPKEMNYDEVCKYTKERDEKNTKKEEK